MDPVKKAAVICAVLACLQLLVGGFVFMSAEGPDLRVLGLACLGVGAIYLGLAYGISQESAICALVAAVLATLNVIGAVKAGLCGLFISAMIMVAMWKGFFEIQGLKGRESQAQDREIQARLREEQWARQGDMYGARNRPSGRQRAAPQPVPAAEEPAAAEPPPKPAGPKMVCPNCHAYYPLGTATCTKCRVGLFED